MRCKCAPAPLKNPLLILLHASVVTCTLMRGSKLCLPAHEPDFYGKSSGSVVLHDRPILIFIRKRHTVASFGVVHIPAHKIGIANIAASGDETSGGIFILFPCAIKRLRVAIGRTLTASRNSKVYTASGFLHLL